MRQRRVTTTSPPTSSKGKPTSTESPTLAPALVAVVEATAALNAAIFDPNREGFTDITALVDAFAAAREAGHAEEDIDAAAARYRQLHHHIVETWIDRTLAAPAPQPNTRP